MMREVLARLSERGDLSRDQAREAFVDILEGRAEPAHIAAFAAALRVKGETADEIMGCASAMRDHMVRIEPGAAVILDTCGTGGDGKGTLNISTLAAIVAAADGIVVAKHGNRAASSRCGSADILERLGVKIDLAPDGVQRCLASAGIAFLFAPNFHPALKAAAPVRRELPFRTIFNLLGPLSNPAGAKFQTLGAPTPPLAALMAEALIGMGSKAVIAFSSSDGLDEISPCAETSIVHDDGASARRFTLAPEDCGLARSSPEGLKGSDAESNAARARAVLKGERGAYRDAVLLASSACFVVTGRSRTFREGVERAAALVDRGTALTKLLELVKASNG